MFKKIKHKIANYYAKKAYEEIIKGDFQAIMRSLNYLKKSVSIMPSSQQLTDFVKEMKTMVKAYEMKIKEELSR